MNTPDYPWTPLHITLILHFHRTGERYEHHEAAIVIEYTQHLADLGLIEESPRPNRFALTDKGQAFIEMICATPCPKQVWKDPRF